MAYHFSANQYNDRYSPRKLGNWEYPKWYPERPRQRHKSTKIIANDEGRLLEGIKRGNAWGNYVGTWDLPKRITREYVKKLVAPPERLVKLWESKKDLGERPKQNQRVDEQEETKNLPGQSEYLPALNYSSPAERNFQRRNESSSALDLRPRPTPKLEPLVLTAPDRQTTVGPTSLNERIQNILDSVRDKPKLGPSTPKEICPEIKVLPKHSRERPVVPHVRDFDKGKEEECEGYLNSLKTHLDKYEEVNDDQEEVEEDQQVDIQFDTPGSDVKMKEKPVSAVEPPGNGISHVQIAKRYHEENLRHKPLPDMVDDAVLKALRSDGRSQPEDGLSVRGMPSAIGWKSYAVPGPTECSKLKVYRPKTALEKMKPQKDDRPKTSVSKDQKKKRFLPIDLAICWDLKPEEPSDEPKESGHIDGTNGSAAPAVFTMIKSKKPEEEEQQVPSSWQAMSERILNGIDEDNMANLPSQMENKPSRTPPSGRHVNKEAIMTCVRSSPTEKKSSDSPASTNSISTNAAEYARQNPKTAWSNEDTGKALSNRLLQLQKETTKRTAAKGPKTEAAWTSPWESLQACRKKLHQSTPNLAGTSSEKPSPGTTKDSGQSKNRSCSSETKLQKTGQRGKHCCACDKPNSDLDKTPDRTEFKTAFKAGVPQSESSHSANSTAAAKSYKAPKMRLPYAKRSYSIGTLVPPFSLWPESKGQDYPEHWRLASVYQHSYKPINTRKRPMLASVYQ